MASHDRYINVKHSLRTLLILTVQEKANDRNQEPLRLLDVEQTLFSDCEL